MSAPTMPRTLLLTGFEPFLNVAVNPSGEIAGLLDGSILRTPGERGIAVRIAGAVLPVSFERAPGAFARSLAGLETPPLAVLSLGVHRGPGFRLEVKAGVEFKSSKPDNDGRVGEAVTLEGPRVRYASVDMVSAQEWLIEAGAPSVTVSDDAGGFLCERVFREGLDKAEEGGFPTLFLHVPPVDAVPVEVQTQVIRGFVERLVERLAALAVS